MKTKRGPAFDIEFSSTQYRVRNMLRQLFDLPTGLYVEQALGLYDKAGEIVYVHVKFVRSNEND